MNLRRSAGYACLFCCRFAFPGEDFDFTEEIRERARRLGHGLVHAWQTGAVEPAAEQTMAAFRERMRQLMLWRQQEWPYEYEYWKSRRGADMNKLESFHPPV